MNQTIELEAEAYALARRLAAERHRSIGRVLSDAVFDRVETGLPAVGEVVIDQYGWPVVRTGRRITSEEVRTMIAEDED